MKTLKVKAEEENPHDSEISDFGKKAGSLLGHTHAQNVGLPSKYMISHLLLPSQFVQHFQATWETDTCPYSVKPRHSCANAFSAHSPALCRIHNVKYMVRGKQAVTQTSLLVLNQDKMYHSPKQMVQFTFSNLS